MSDPVEAAWEALEREACVERGVQRERLAPAIDKHRPLIEAAIRSESAGTGLDVERIRDPRAWWAGYMARQTAELDGFREEVRQAVQEGDAQDCSSADCIADAVYEIARVRFRSESAGTGLDVTREITLHPGQHEFRTVCRLCGDEGILHVAVITHNERVTISDIRSESAGTGLDDPKFRAAVDAVFAAPGDFGPAKGYYGEATDHFIDMLKAEYARLSSSDTER